MDDARPRRGGDMDPARYRPARVARPVAPPSCRPVPDRAGTRRRRGSPVAECRGCGATARAALVSGHPRHRSSTVNAPGWARRSCEPSSTTSTPRACPRTWSPPRRATSPSTDRTVSRSPARSTAARGGPTLWLMWRRAPPAGSLKTAVSASAVGHAHRAQRPFGPFALRRPVPDGGLRGAAPPPKGDRAGSRARRASRRRGKCPGCAARCRRARGGRPSTATNRNRGTQMGRDGGGRQDGGAVALEGERGQQPHAVELDAGAELAPRLA